MRRAHQEPGDHARTPGKWVQQRQDLAHPNAPLRLRGIMQHILQQPHQCMHTSRRKHLCSGVPCNTLRRRDIIKNPVNYYSNGASRKQTTSILQGACGIH